MTIEDIKALIVADESRTLELKKSTGELKDGMHAAVEDTLAKWKLTVNGVPTNGAAMLFSNNIYPYNNFPDKVSSFSWQRQIGIHRQSACGR